MLMSFFESFKYVGHLVPIAALRIYLGVYCIYEFSSIYNEGILPIDQLKETIYKNLSPQESLGGYQKWLIESVIDHWQFVAYFTLITILLIGISFTAGFMVRIFSLIAVFISSNILMLCSLDEIMLHQILIAVNLTFCWVGAGRCVGIDYFFYKKNRGLFW